MVAYLHAWQVTSDPDFLQVVTETVEYVLRDLATSGSAGLSAAEDADSEGVEGLFYTWTPEEIAGVLSPQLASAAISWYGVTERGNFEGRSILRRPKGAPLERPADVEQAWAELFEARSKRVRPGRDDKVLTEWNAMFASALAQAAAATGREDWARRAEDIGNFILIEARRSDGRLMRSWQDGSARDLAYASDYAWVVDCFTRLGELTGKASWLEHATRDGLRDARSLLRPSHGRHLDHGIRRRADAGQARGPVGRRDPVCCVSGRFCDAEARRARWATAG